MAFVPPKPPASPTQSPFASVDTESFMANSSGRKDLYAAFKKDLASRTIRPGERLGEESLAIRWKVGRATVREALLKLEQDGVVYRKSRSGTFVRALDEAELMEVYDLRKAIESTIAGRAAEVATDQEAQELAELARRLDEASLKGIDNHAIHRMFHWRLAEIAKYKYAARILRLTHVLSLCARYYDLIFMLGMTHRSTQLDHRAIADAIRSRDPEKAAELMRQHIENKKRRVIEDLSKIVKGMEQIAAPLVAIE